MSVRIYFSKSDEPWDEERLARASAKLPVGMVEKITRYKAPADRQSRVQGKLLLMKMIEDFGLGMTLDEMQYTEYNKPYFAAVGPGFDFSISHCDGLVVCAGILCGKIGIDAELLRDMDIDDYRQQLTTSEWYQINHSANKSKALLEAWTKKEALQKATGRGIEMDMSYIDASNKVITVHKEHYSFFPVVYDERYICYIAVYVDNEAMRQNNVRFEMTAQSHDDIA